MTNSMNLDAYMVATKCEHLGVATRRIVSSLHGDGYKRVPVMDSDIGYWTEKYRNDFRDTGKLNGEIRTIVDRVQYEADQLDDGIMEKVTEEQFAAIVSWAANKTLGDSTLMERVKDYNGHMSYTEDMELADAYTKAAAGLVAWLNGNREKVDGDSDDDEMLYINMDEEQEQDDEKPDMDDDDDTEKTRIFLIPKDDFGKYLNRDAASFEVLSKLVDQIPSLAITIDSEIEVDPEGSIVKPVQLDINKLHKMTHDGYAAMAADPIYFAVKLASKDLQMMERYSQTESKRVELVMIDASGSMCTQDGDRMIRALAYLYNRLDKVIEGKATIAVAFFGDRVLRQSLESVTDGSPAWLIDTPEKAERAKDEFHASYTRFTGGQLTNIPSAVATGYGFAQDLADQVKLNPEYAADGLPHMTVITDEDSGSVNVEKVNGFTVNALVVVDNPGMQNLCQETGGVYMPLNAVRINAVK